MPSPSSSPAPTPRARQQQQNEDDAVTVGFVVLSPFTVVCPLIFRDYTVDKGMLEISRLYPGDQGTYVCQALNDFGQNEKDNYYISVGGIVN